MSFLLPEALLPLTEYPNFLLHRKKVPIDPRTLRTFPKGSGLKTVAFQDLPPIPEGYGVGFLFTSDDPFFLIDIDSCIYPDRTKSKIAEELLVRLDGAAVETSQSGKGLHIIGKGFAQSHACKNGPLGIEFYTENRFVALTGRDTTGSASKDCSSELEHIVREYFTPKAKVATHWTTEPTEGYGGPEDDGELLMRAISSSSAGSTFGTKASFSDLFSANIHALKQAYPHPNIEKPYDFSQADAALAQHLAFWTGKNCERTERIMRMSALVREKWDRDDYLPRTILNAVSMQSNVYKMHTPTQPVDTSTLLGPKKVSGFQYLAADQQIEHFKGCVYVQDLHRVHTPTGALLRPEQFNASYGGYVFQLDETGDKTTKKAWEAFTESQVVRYPIAASSCFRPDLTPGGILTIDGSCVVNTYIPLHTASEEGDVGPFITHLKKLLPDERDRCILLSYMSACVQHKGRKFQWAPLIQGVEGNGKTLLTRCVAYAIGDKYTHFPLANELSEKFNEWLFGKLFIGVEDVYSDNKRELIEILKPMITNLKLAKRAMQQAQVTCDSRANFMLNTNHRDALQKTKTDRRFCVFYTAQQNASDLALSGMDGDYFPKLYAWLDNTGYAKVNHFLQNYKISEEFDPAGACHRAPETTSTLEAVAASGGRAEQIVREAIEEGEIGFCGGWVSSIHLDRILRENHLSEKVPPGKRRELLQNIGYEWHPALPCGRSPSTVIIDGMKKPRLYVKVDHPSLSLESASDVVKAYIKDNS